MVDAISPTKAVTSEDGKGLLAESNHRRAQKNQHEKCVGIHLWAQEDVEAGNRQRAGFEPPDRQPDRARTDGTGLNRPEGQL